MLRHFVYILFFIIGLNFTSFAQTKSLPNGDGAKLIRLYPTPASTFINFDFVNGYDKSLSFQIYNFTGKLLYQLQNPPSKINLTLTDFSRGFYFYQIRDKSGKIIETVRFLVIK